MAEAETAPEQRALAVVQQLQRLLADLPAAHPAAPLLTEALQVAIEYWEATKPPAEPLPHPEDYWAARWRT